MPMALPAESPLSQASIALRWLARVRRTPLLCTQLTRVSLLTSTPMYRGVATMVCIRVSPRAKVCGLGWATCRRYLAVQSAVKALGAMPLDSSSTLHGMWVGEISGSLSITTMAERRGSPSTPAPLKYLSQGAPFTAYEEGCPRSGRGGGSLPEEGCPRSGRGGGSPPAKPPPALAAPPPPEGGGEYGW